MFLVDVNMIDEPELSVGYKDVGHLAKLFFEVDLFEGRLHLVSIRHNFRV